MNVDAGKLKITLQPGRQLNPISGPIQTLNRKITLAFCFPELARFAYHVCSDPSSSVSLVDGGFAGGYLPYVARNDAGCEVQLFGLGLCVRGLIPISPCPRPTRLPRSSLTDDPVPRRGRRGIRISLCFRVGTLIKLLYSS